MLITIIILLLFLFNVYFFALLLAGTKEKTQEERIQDLMNCQTFRIVLFDRGHRPEERTPDNWYKFNDALDKEYKGTTKNS